MKCAESKIAAKQPAQHGTLFRKENARPFFPSHHQSTPFFSRNPARPGAIQRRLKVGQPNDHYEKEADHMADRVVRRQSTIQRKPIFESKAEPPDDTIQRKCAACEKEEKQVQKKPDAAPLTNASPGIESSLNASRGSGSPLPKNTRAQMETSFGADFSGVRIHNDNAAVQMSEGLHAQAFTSGRDIYFNKGKYDSGSKTGQHLLAHELTHVVQQTGNRDSIQRMPSWDDIVEEAGEVADDVESGVAAAGQAVSSGVDAVTDYVKTEAGKLAVALANSWLEQYGGSARALDSGGIEVRLPEITIIDRYAKTFPWDASTPDAILGQFPVSLGELGVLFLTLFARGQMHASLTAGIGPLQLKDVILTIDPKADFYSGEATLTAPADLTGILELTGILGGSGDWNCAIEIAKVEGGLSGTATAGTTKELSDKAKVTYQDDKFNFDNNLTLENCLQFSFDLNAMANLFLMQMPVWSGNWTLASWPWEKCWNISLPLKDDTGSSFTGGGGQSGGGGSSGSWDDSGTPPATPTPATPAPDAPSPDAPSPDAASPTPAGNANQPDWDASDMLKALFLAASIQPNLPALDMNAKEKIEDACPTKKDKPTKPYSWNTPHQYEDMNGVFTYSKTVPGAKYITHAHHVWPKNIGGPEKQTRLNVNQTIHLSEFHGTGGIHTFLSASLSKELGGLQISRLKSDPGNQLLIKKMRGDQALRRKVFKLLSTFYQNYRNQSYPELPTWTYLTGLNEAVNNITP